MKKYSIYIIIPLCIIILFFACSGKPVDGPGIDFKAEIYDFGEVNEGEDVSHSFVFKNNGNETVLITSVRPTCGCTVAGEYDSEVPPGGNGTIPVVLKTNNYQGEISKVIRVTTNVPEKEEIILTLRGSVYTPVSIQPRVLWLGQVTSGTSPLTGFFTVKNNDKTPLKIENIISPSDNVTVETTTVKKNKEYQVDITVEPPFGEGRVMKEITIETNNPYKRALKVHFSYTVKAGITVYPQVISVEQGPAKQEFERMVIIENSYPGPAEVINPQIMGGNLDFQIQEITPGKLFQIILTFPVGFTLKGKEMIILSFQVESAGKTEVYNIAIKPEE